MTQILIYFLIGIILSIDAFSLTLSISTKSIRKRDMSLLTIMIGICHFIMPIIGNTFGRMLIKHITMNTNSISGIIFLLLAMNLLFQKEEEKEIKSMNILMIILLSITVSIDSMNVGLAIGLKKESMIIPSIIFMAVSSISTWFGFLIGNKIKETFQLNSKYIGIIILIIVSMKYFFSR